MVEVPVLLSVTGNWHTVLLTWTQPAGSTVRSEFKRSADSTWLPGFSGLTGSPAHLGGMQEQTSYDFRLFAQAGGEESAASNVVSFTMQKKPNLE